MTKFFSSFNWLICTATTLAKDGQCLANEIPTEFIPQTLQVPSIISGILQTITGQDYTTIFVAPIQLHGKYLLLKFSIFF